jgi:hypothetical protein
VQDRFVRGIWKRAQYLALRLRRPMQHGERLIAVTGEEERVEMLCIAAMRTHDHLLWHASDLHDGRLEPYVRSRCCQELADVFARAAASWVEPPLIIRSASGAIHPEYAAVKLSVGFPP